MLKSYGYCYGKSPTKLARVTLHPGELEMYTIVAISAIKYSMSVYETELKRRYTI
jgi:hypothetical protein